MTDPRDSSSPEIIDEALRLITAPVAVIGAASGGMLGGLTASWVTRVSVDPPLLLVSIGRERFTYDLLCRSEEFSVSLLHADQVEIGRLFGLHSRRDRDKWAEVDHDLLGQGVPALLGCTARFLCRKENTVPAGDHDLFIGRILTAEVAAGPPALPMRGTDYAPR